MDLWQCFGFLNGFWTKSWSNITPIFCSQKTINWLRLWVRAKLQSIHSSCYNLVRAFFPQNSLGKFEAFHRFTITTKQWHEFNLTKYNLVDEGITIFDFKFQKDIVLLGDCSAHYIICFGSSPIRCLVPRQGGNTVSKMTRKFCAGWVIADAF